MARWKKPTKEEVLQNRRTLAERARAGDLRLPGAVADIRKGIGMTQEEFAKALGYPDAKLQNWKQELPIPHWRH